MTPAAAVTQPGSDSHRTTPTCHSCHSVTQPRLTCENRSDSRCDTPTGCHTTPALTTRAKEECDGHATGA
ncbi:hypothetical protein GCM10017786_50280 [Amycolatopsis deserti]|uniref:Uncharacterized protein n=1 Tax=Amycolatopsis deserti TaxID=185696 RepID=A0ABQ3JCJ5_9PSEU|nr:hypothetical protein GCM10017786_50280 [Amycolatopsis deserti]